MQGLHRKRGTHFNRLLFTFKGTIEEVINDVYQTSGQLLHNPVNMYTNKRYINSEIVPILA